MKRKKQKTEVFLYFLLIAGIMLILYPTVSDKYNSRRATSAIQNYVKEQEAFSQETVDRLISAAKEYNSNLGDHSGEKLTDRELEEYYNILNFDKDGIMGYIEIPQVKIKMPIYHGTSDDVLASGAGHIEWSDFPVGGEGTHAVISGHRGLPNAKMFTRLDELVPGDRFYITVLNIKLTYEVSEVQIVLPEDIDSLKKEEGEDKVTLVTCTPYGINTHRLLVTGVRCDDEDSLSLNIKNEAVPTSPDMIAVAAAVFSILFMVISGLLIQIIGGITHKWKE